MKSMQVAVKRNPAVYESALLVDGRFQGAGAGISAWDVISYHLTQRLSGELPVGSEVIVSVTIETPEEEKSE